MNMWLAPVRERRASFEPSEVDAIIREGTDRARAVASETLRDVRAAMRLAP
jgi:hypothetical protein